MNKQHLSSQSLQWLSLTAFLTGIIGSIMQILFNDSELVFGLAPSFVVMVIYFWLVLQPVLISYLAIAIIGLFYDIISGNIIGFESMLLIFIKYIIQNGRLFIIKKTFYVSWLGFTLIVIIYYLIKYFLIYFYAAEYIFLYSALITIILYPLISYILSFIARFVIK